MRCNLVSLGHVSSNRAVKIVDIAKTWIVAIEKECCPLTSGLQLIQNSVCIDIRTVIESQGNSVWLGAAVKNHTIRQGRLALSYHMAGCDSGQQTKSNKLQKQNHCEAKTFE
jgi:hypothetical protein